MYRIRAGSIRLSSPRSGARISAKKDNVYRAALKFDLDRPAGTEVETCAGAGLAGVIYQATQENATGDFDALIAALRRRATEFHIDPARGDHLVRVIERARWTADRDGPESRLHPRRRRLLRRCGHC
ncbi:MAG TPA: hypothetical protein VGK04_07460 [Thermoanaerobaculia bacterium]|jgi:hypothetical protein